MVVMVVNGSGNGGVIIYFGFPDMVSQESRSWTRVGIHIQWNNNKHYIFWLKVEKDSSVKLV